MAELHFKKTHQLLKYVFYRHKKEKGTVLCTGLVTLTITKLYNSNSHDFFKQ